MNAVSDNDDVRRPPLVSAFDIVGLYGYKNIGIETDTAASILIARNGSGKTTLLAALDAFLKKQFVRLKDIQFEEIRCKLWGTEEAFSIQKRDLDEVIRASESDKFNASARRIGVEPIDLFNFLEGELPALPANDYYDSRIFSAILTTHDYRVADALRFCEEVRQSYYFSNPRIKATWEGLTRSLDGIEILYLPTYRRIELPVHEPEEKVRSARRRRPAMRTPPISLISGDINFGLSDISSRLEELNKQILVVSNSSYRNISADIIKELLDGTFDDSQYDLSDLPSMEEIQLFLSRLRDRRYRMGPFQDLNIPNLEKLYASTLPSETNKFLRYFLGKLNTAMSSTKKVEALVEAFIASCNKYLSSQDPSTEINQRVPAAGTADGKLLRFNRRDLSVHVESIPSRRVISLDALSSGEKQMISLFAKMFLSENNKIVLIDEPELSLSIGWQREIIPDIMRAQSCAQVIAITHSPFIFDNDLEGCARPLTVTIDESSLPGDRDADNDIDDQI